MEVLAFAGLLNADVHKQIDCLENAERQIETLLSLLQQHRSKMDLPTHNDLKSNPVTIPQKAVKSTSKETHQERVSAIASPSLLSPERPSSPKQVTPLDDVLGKPDPAPVKSPHIESQQTISPPPRPSDYRKSLPVNHQITSHLVAGPTPSAPTFKPFLTTRKSNRNLQVNVEPTPPSSISNANRSSTSSPRARGQLRVPSAFLKSLNSRIVTPSQRGSTSEVAKTSTSMTQKETRSVTATPTDVQQPTTLTMRRSSMLLKTESTQNTLRKRTYRKSRKSLRLDPEALAGMMEKEREESTDPLDHLNTPAGSTGLLVNLKKQMPKRDIRKPSRQRPTRGT
ncbi:hypothetical protein PROFUN_04926 [Planoprotostelium fungivorum]|uniref:Uncharacterized protein n=1 Tax=Planoprotostelium fungivorum TaxID=1890364 RepID=A0A2P6NFB4_9EUKA|nr:hypothetical protein PROFUN_04926 [Planoprotostelium fungivorum]